MKNRKLIIIPQFGIYPDFFRENGFDVIDYSEELYVQRNVLLTTALALMQPLLMFRSPVLLKLYGWINAYRSNYKRLNNYLLFVLDGEKKCYDFILIIKGLRFEIELIERIDSLGSNVCLYFWDSIVVYPSIYNSVKQLSWRKFTFDILDARRFGLSFLPMPFLSNETCLVSNTDRNGIIFIGRFSIFRLIFFFNLLFLRNIQVDYFLKVGFNFKISFLGRNLSLIRNQIVDTTDYYSNAKYYLSVNEFSLGGYSERIKNAVLDGKRCVLDKELIKILPEELSNYAITFKDLYSNSIPFTADFEHRYYLKYYWTNWLVQIEGLRE